MFKLNFVVKVNILTAFCLFKWQWKSISHFTHETLLKIKNSQTDEERSEILKEFKDITKQMRRCYEEMLEEQKQKTLEGFDDKIIHSIEILADSGV